MRTKRPANRATRHQIDELYIGHVDYSVEFDVGWAPEEDGDGRFLGYSLDEIVLLTVKRFDEEAYVAIEADDKLQASLEEAIRYQEERYGTLTEEANQRSER